MAFPDSGSGGGLLFPPLVTREPRQQQIHKVDSMVMWMASDGPDNMDFQGDLRWRQSLVPAWPPPPGVTPNFVNPVSRARDVTIPSIILTAVAGIFVIMRIYTRSISHALGLDDWIIIISTVLSVVVSVLCVHLVKYGLGLHQWDVPLTDFSPGFLYHLHVLLLVYWVLPPLIKLSILIMYLRIFTVSKTMKWATYATIIVQGIYTTVFMGIEIWSCNPRQKMWDLTIQHGRCFDIATMSLIGATFDAVTDVIVLLLPLPSILALKLPPRQRYAVMTIFMTGMFATATGFVRLAVYAHYTYRKPDLTWTLVPTLLWCTLEANIGIVCACLPLFKPLLRKIYPPILGPVAGARHTPNSGGAAHGRSTLSSRLSQADWLSTNSFSSSSPNDDTTTTTTRDERNKGRYLQLQERVVAVNPIPSSRTRHAIAPTPPPIPTTTTTTILPTTESIVVVDTAAPAHRSPRPSLTLDDRKRRAPQSANHHHHHHHQTGGRLSPSSTSSSTFGGGEGEGEGPGEEEGQGAAGGLPALPENAILKTVTVTATTSERRDVLLL